MKLHYIYLFVLLNVVPCFAQVCCCDIIQTTIGFVEAGSSSVLELTYPKSFDICLSSERGDADLYVSNRNPSPSYEPASYLFHSATCGDEIIHVNEKLKRPIYVSIFGHPSAELSVYYLNIVSRESTEEDLINLELLDLEEEDPLNSTRPIEEDKGPGFKINDKLEELVAKIVDSEQEEQTESAEFSTTKIEHSTDIKTFFVSFLNLLSLILL